MLLLPLKTKSSAEMHCQAVLSLINLTTGTLAGVQTPFLPPNGSREELGMIAMIIGDDFIDHWG